MTRKIRITEAQLKNLIRQKLREDYTNINFKDEYEKEAYETLVKIMNNEITDYRISLEDDIKGNTFSIEGEYLIECNGFSFVMVVESDIDYEITHDDGDYWTPQYSQCDITLKTSRGKIIYVDFDKDVPEYFNDIINKKTIDGKYSLSDICALHSIEYDEYDKIIEYREECRKDYHDNYDYRDE